MFKKISYFIIFTFSLMLGFIANAKADSLTIDIGDCTHDIYTTCNMYLNVPEGAKLDKDSYFYLIISSGIDEKGLITPNEGIIYYDEYFFKAQYSAANYGKNASASTDRQSFKSGANIMFKNDKGADITTGRHEIAKVSFSETFDLNSNGLPLNVFIVDSSKINSVITHGNLRMYTDANAEITNMVEYMENTNKKSCAIIRLRNSSSIGDEDDNTYFDKSGEIVFTYDEWKASCLNDFKCSEVPTYSYNINYGSFYLDKNGDEVESEQALLNVCPQEQNNSGSNNGSGEESGTETNNGSGGNSGNGSGNQTTPDDSNSSNLVNITDAEYRDKVQKYASDIVKAYVMLLANGEDVTIENVVKEAKKLNNSGITCNKIEKSGDEISLTECNIPGYVYKKDILVKDNISGNTETDTDSEKEKDVNEEKESKVDEKGTKTEEENNSSLIQSGKCYKKDGKFYNSKGEEIAESEWSNQCEEPARTGASLNYFIIPLGLIVSYVLFRAYKKKSLIRNI